ncbi:putative cytochrome P450 [Didymella exigua CBS 183.55]|uniref:Putative cytochrome P450 n=1 Tax=Didymella exigua CBS 183.55 TaxID=1150837 RepID=A0A6A5RF05_9PLEO|nr:putative cytochrome P450 [Didymella exigua CBS 183.55]KAF1924287.1 putative cytochrome P450 [Didymella exigua CBS 183.55]
MAQKNLGAAVLQIVWFLAPAARFVPLALLALAVFKCTRSGNILPGVPKLAGLPFIGVLLLSMRRGVSEILVQLQNIATDGISYASMAGSALVFVHDPALIRQLLMMPEESLSRESNEDQIGFSPFWVLRRIVGPSLIDYRGPHLGTYRGGFIREFNSTEALAKNFDTIKRHAQAHVNCLVGQQADNGIVDIVSRIDIFAITLWRALLYGSSDSEINDRVLDLSKAIGARVTDPWPSLWYSIIVFLGLVDPGHAFGPDKVLRTQLDELIEESIEQLKNHERLNPEAPQTSLRGLSTLTYGGISGPLSQTAIGFAHLNAFAGSETFGYNLAWMLIELEKRPDCLERLLAEIESSNTEDFRIVNSKMPYLDAVVKEVNRLHSPVASTFRTVNREISITTCKSYYTLQPGMLVYLALGCANRSTTDWGSDADKFMPERWLKSKEDNTSQLTFGYGSRSCVGFKTALFGTKMYLLSLLQMYQIALRDHDYKESPGDILGAEKPLVVELHRRRLR